MSNPMFSQDEVISIPAFHAHVNAVKGDNDSSLNTTNVNDDPAFPKEHFGSIYAILAAIELFAQTVNDIINPALAKTAEEEAQLSQIVTANENAELDNIIGQMNGADDDTMKRLSSLFTDMQSNYSAELTPLNNETQDTVQKSQNESNFLTQVIQMGGTALTELSNASQALMKI